jgi:hypothetical protein
MTHTTAFWDWHRCRLFIEQAIEHYKAAPGWFTGYLGDLYIRIAEDMGAIRLVEISTLSMLCENGVWEQENMAVNRIYKLFDRLGIDTTGIAGY